MSGAGEHLVLEEGAHGRHPAADRGWRRAAAGPEGHDAARPRPGWPLPGDPVEDVGGDDLVAIEPASDREAGEVQQVVGVGADGG